MGEMPDVNGTRVKDTWMFKKIVAAGAISVDVDFPGPGHDFFLVLPVATWPLGQWEVTRTGKTLTLNFSTPAPVGGGTIRGAILI